MFSLKFAHLKDFKYRVQDKDSDLKYC